MGYGGGTAVPNDQTKPAQTNGVYPVKRDFTTSARMVWKPQDFSREITLVDQGFTDDLSEYVTEVSIPVRGIK